MGALFLSTLLAGMAYVLIPGPATLAALSLSATRGRGVCARFLAAHFIGDVAWAALSILAIIGVSGAGPVLFHGLGLVCGAYLVWLGVRALRSTGPVATPILRNPWRAGLAFGLTNPKAYPFAMAMFTTALSATGTQPTLALAPLLVASAAAGFVAATALVVGWTGLPVTRRIFRRHAGVLTRAIGIVFIAFGVKTAADAVAGLRAG